MEIIKYVIFAFILIVSFMQIINPHILWRASRWQWKNPQANEPSKAGFTVQRIGGAIVFIGVILIFVTQLK